jgi:hypothetical protein
MVTTVRAVILMSAKHMAETFAEALVKTPEEATDVAAQMVSRS